MNADLLQTLIVSKCRHEQTAELLRAKLAEAGVLATVLCHDGDLEALVRQESVKDSCSYRLVVLLSEDGADRTVIGLSRLTETAGSVWVITVDVRFLSTSLMSELMSSHLLNFFVLVKGFFADGPRSYSASPRYDVPLSDSELEILHRTASRIESSVKEAQQLVTLGEFSKARHTIGSLPDSPESLASQKQHWLRQIDEAELHMRIVKQAEQLVRRGEFARAREAIRSLPDASEEVARRKQGWLNEIDDIERRTVSTLHRAGSRGWLRRLMASRLRPPEPPATVFLAPSDVADRVHFSVTSPAALDPGSTHVIDVWAHLEHHRQRVVERAHEEARSKKIQVKTKGPVRAERGVVFAVRLKIQDLVVAPAEDTILWEGEIGNATFLVTVSEGAKPGLRPGVARISANGLQVSCVSFVVAVGSNFIEQELQITAARRLRKAFASYASEDQDAVLARVQGLCKALPSLDVFFARKDLRSGENWQTRLAFEIAARDVLYLFWSKAASVSKWVDWEWRLGLETRGIGFIDPFPLVSPEIVPPPKELADEVHFDDWQLAYMRTSSDA